jgi:hypothetical protein
MQHAGGASRVSRLRRRGGGTLATTRPRSPDGVSPSRRSSTHGCWKFRVTSKHIHCLGWRISVSAPLIAWSRSGPKAGEMQRECANHAVPTGVLDVALAQRRMANPD